MQEHGERAMTVGERDTLERGTGNAQITRFTVIGCDN